MSYNITYRPKSLRTFFGNSTVVRSLEAILEQDKVPHAYLFYGQSGVGKTTLARILAKELGVRKENIVELNVANTRGIDTVREVINTCSFSTILGGNKAYIFDEAHMLTNEAMNALLKIIEDCPEHVFFMFCSTNPEKIISTIRSRCVAYELKPLNYEESRALLEYIIKKEELEVADEVISLILKYSAGIPRKLALNLYTCKDLNAEDTRAFLESEVSGATSEVIDVCRMLFRRPNQQLKWSELMKKVDAIVKEDNAESVRRMMFSYFSTILAKAQTKNDVMYFTALLEVLETPLADGSVGKAGLVYMLGRIVVGLELLQ